MPDLITKIKHYEELLKEILEISEKYLGVMSVKLLVERVLWDVSQEYKEITFLRYDENGVSTDALVKALEDTPDFPIDEMFKKFFTRYVEILAKLVGKEPAEKYWNVFQKKFELLFNTKIMHITMEVIKLFESLFEMYGGVFEKQKL